jgi:hypothetical protein
MGCRFGVTPQNAVMSALTILHKPNPAAPASVLLEQVRFGVVAR